MRTPAPLRVGVIGAGGIAQMMHLPHLFERPDLFRLVGLADLSEKTLEDVARLYRPQLVTTDHRTLCTHPEIDAVLLVAGGTHTAPALAALEGGKHLFVEKPLAYGLEETQLLARAAEKSGKTVMVGYHKRFDPAYRRAVELVRGMKDVRYVEVTVLHPDDDAYRTHHVIWPDPDGRRTRAPEPEAAGVEATVAAISQPPLDSLLGGVTAKGAPLAHRVAAKIAFESLIHDLNAVRGLLGAEPEAVLSANLWQGGFAQSSVSRFPKDVHANVSWVAVPGLKHYEERIRIVGSDQRVTLTFPSAYLKNLPTSLEVERMDGGELVVEQRTVSYAEAFQAELEHFRAQVVSGKPVELPPAEAVADARWISGIVQAFAR